MGLDMYLTGEKLFTGQRDKDEDGYEIESIIVSLGYWRKHANLHGYIVKEFANGEDNCQDIDLSIEQLNQLLEAVKDPANLPFTEGFFFGKSANDQDQIDEDVAIITRAIGFLSAPILTGSSRGENSVWRSVTYRASW